MGSVFCVHAIPAFSDNYIWALQHGQQVVVVDPGDTQAVLVFLQRHRLRLIGILITHHHQDHIGGVSALQQAWPSLSVYGPKHLQQVTRHVMEGDEITLPFLEPLVVQVLAVPGHTLDHLAYHIVSEHAVFCGDTLFSAGCGRLFEGTAEQMWTSLRKLAELPAHTRLYPAHEYTLSNLAFARVVEPDNTDLIIRQQQAQALRAENTPTIPTSVQLECATNPFLRTAYPSVQSAVARQYQEPSASEIRTFALLRVWKDHFS